MSKIVKEVYICAWLGVAILDNKSSELCIYISFFYYFKNKILKEAFICKKKKYGEIFHGLEGFYQASNLGRIKSVERIAYKKYRGNRRVNEKILKGSPNEEGYLKVHFKTPFINKIFSIHRLVAKTFIPNPKNLPQINHKDGNKSNNNIDNLEWCTNEENQIHSWKTGLRKYPKKVLQYDLKMNFIKEWESTKEIYKTLHIPNCSISSCCLGKTNHCRNYIWRYKGEN